MKITYLGHSSFLISDGGTRIVTDPYGEIGFSFPHICCDAVTVSHFHYDHCNVGALSGVKAVFDRAGSFLFDGISIEGIPAFHDDCRGAKRGRNVIFKITMGETVLCHLGDLGQRFDGDLVAKIGHVDVLLLPVGGNYTIDGAEAAKYAKAIDPAVIIPMHYFVDGLNIDIEGCDRFLAAMERPMLSVGDTIELSALDARKKIILMERFIDGSDRA